MFHGVIHKITLAQFFFLRHGVYCYCTTYITTLLGVTTVFCGTRNFEPSSGICQLPRNFYVFTEFCGIRYWPVIKGQILHILVVFRWPCCMYTWFHHEIHDCWLGRNGRNVETIDLSLSEIFQVCLVDNCISQLQLLATNTAYLFGGRKN